MCKVTVIPSGDSFFFTSSRDEWEGRQVASFPALHEIRGQLLLFPRDPQGGGSWIAVHESGNMGALLNGAVFLHQHKPPYQKSRGLILLDLISNLSPVNAFKDSDFKLIEPFTVILFDAQKLYSCKWDGNKKWLASHSTLEPQIWSSVTLYDSVTIYKRETWFKNWISLNPFPSADEIIRFHLEAGDGDPCNDLLMNREGRIFTNSISSVGLSGESASFRYVDLRDGISGNSFLPFQKQVSAIA
jgi:Transport and Golgi organisation 2